MLRYRGYPYLGTFFSPLYTYQLCWSDFDLILKHAVVHTLFPFSFFALILCNCSICSSSLFPSSRAFCLQRPGKTHIRMTPPPPPEPPRRVPWMKYGTRRCQTSTWSRLKLVTLSNLIEICYLDLILLFLN